MSDNGGREKVRIALLGLVNAGQEEDLQDLDILLLKMSFATETGLQPHVIQVKPNIYRVYPDFHRREELFADLPLGEAIEWLDEQIHDIAHKDHNLLRDVRDPYADDGNH